MRAVTPSPVKERVGVDGAAAWWLRWGVNAPAEMQKPSGVAQRPHCLWAGSRASWWRSCPSPWCSALPPSTSVASARRRGGRFRGRGGVSAPLAQRRRPARERGQREEHRGRGYDNKPAAKTVMKWPQPQSSRAPPPFPPSARKARDNMPERG